MGQYAAALKGESWDESKHPRDETGRFTEANAPTHSYAGVLHSSQRFGVRSATPDFRTPIEPTPDFRTELSPHTTPYKPPPPKKPSTFPPVPPNPAAGTELLPAALTPEAIHRGLGDLRILEEHSIKRLGGGVMGSHLVEATDAHGNRDTYAYKPEKEADTRFLLKPEEGSISQREVAAFEVDRALGLGVVPETFLSDLSRGVGSVQHFVPNAMTGTELGSHPDWMPGKLPGSNQQWYHMAVLDAIIANPDRHSSNYIFDKQGNLHAIDHGLAFEPREGRRLDAFGLKMPDESTIPVAVSRELVRRLRKTDWRALLSPRLSGQTLEETLVRVQQVADAIESKTLYPSFFHNFDIYGYKT